MWYLIAFLTCLGVAHTRAPGCLCPEKEWDFVVLAKVSNKNDDDSYLTKYYLTDTETFKTKNGGTTIGMVATNKAMGPLQAPCPAQLDEGKRYVLKGYFGEDGGLAMIDGCGVHQICSQESGKRN